MSLAFYAFGISKEKSKEMEEIGLKSVNPQPYILVWIIQPSLDNLERGFVNEFILIKLKIKLKKRR